MAKLIYRIIALLSLLVLVGGYVAYLVGRAEMNQLKTVATVCTIVWFIFASLWMWKDEPENS